MALPCRHGLLDQFHGNNESLRLFEEWISDFPMTRRQPASKKKDSPAGTGRKDSAPFLLFRIHDQDEIRRQGHGRGNLAAAVARDIDATLRHQANSLRVGGVAVLGPQTSGFNSDTWAELRLQEAFRNGTPAMIPFAENQDGFG